MEILDTPPPRRFADLPLAPEILAAVEDAGYDEPTPIQSEIIPALRSGRNILAQSQTGTGKTAAFALPALSNIDLARREPQVLVLAPTRELAMQVAQAFVKYGSRLPKLGVVAIYGGQDYEVQFRQLKRGMHVVVGTPGRVIDHIKRGTLKLDAIKCLVLDEADEMLNMGFLEDVRFVLAEAPKERQTALFSATLPKQILSIAKENIADPFRVTIKTKTVTADNIRQRAVFVSPKDKIDALHRILEVEPTDGVIVFVRTREATLTVADELSLLGHRAIALNGDMAQKLRERTVENLRNGQLDILVATDVAARGLDVSRISHVVNFDAPHDAETYIHRIGRTGRAGRKGEALIFLTWGQRMKLRIIESATKQPIQTIDVPGASAVNAVRTERVRERLSKVLESEDLETYEKLLNQYAEDTGSPPLSIAAALFHLAYSVDAPFFLTDSRSKKKTQGSSRSDYGQESDRDAGRGRNGRPTTRERSPRRDHDDAPAPNDRSEARPAKRSNHTRRERYRIEVGTTDGAKPGNILGAIASEGQIDGRDIGQIDMLDTFSFVELPADLPNATIAHLKKTWVAGKPLNLTPAHRREDQSLDRSAGRGHTPKEGRTYPAKEGRTFAAKEGRTFPPKEGRTYPAKEGRTFAAKEGRTYPAKEGRTFAAKEGRTYPAKEGRTFAAKEGRTYPAKEGRTFAAKEGHSVSPREGRSDDRKEGKPVRRREEPRDSRSEERPTRPKKRFGLKDGETRPAKKIVGPRGGRKALPATGKKSLKKDKRAAS
jgi:ATP-dependent RNA helicase DeaD